ncbi:34320_t:CDS:2, partial [Gigaspora margarita]
EDINMMDIEEEDLPTEQEAFKAAMQKHTTIPKITRCEANFLGDYIHNKVWKTMKPQLPLIAEDNLEPCQNFQYTSDGFIFDNIPKYNWSYVEFLNIKFGARKKEKNKYILNWCGPDAQCWCKNILYQSKSWCKQCYTDYRIWNALKQIPVRKLAICYEETSIQKETESMELFTKAAKFNNWCHDTDNWPIEETIPASEGWPELVTESETDM